MDLGDLSSCKAYLLNAKLTEKNRQNLIFLGSSLLYGFSEGWH